MQSRKRGDAAVALTQGKPEAPAAAAPPPEPPLAPTGFMTVLVTPKITFSLPRRPHWKVVEDIPQEDLREAFLSRFPVRFDPTKLNFRSAQPPSCELATQDRLVYRIGSDGSDEERVLLGILCELDKAYSARYEKQLEEARADLLSSSMTFQVIADEIRSGQQVWRGMEGIGGRRCGYLVKDVSK